MTTLSRFILFASLSTYAFSTSANENSMGSSSETQSGFYIGAGLGSSDFDTEGFDDPMGFEIFGGYNFNKNFAIEASYVDFGSASDNEPPEFNISADTLGISVVGKLPLADNFELYGQFGYHLWNVDFFVDGFGATAATDGSDLFYGIGANFKLTKQLDLGVKYADYRLENNGSSAEISMYSLNIQYRF